MPLVSRLVDQGASRSPRPLGVFGRGPGPPAGAARGLQGQRESGRRPRPEAPFIQPDVVAENRWVVGPRGDCRRLSAV